MSSDWKFMRRKISRLNRPILIIGAPDRKYYVTYAVGPRSVAKITKTFPSMPDVQACWQRVKLGKFSLPILRYSGMEAVQPEPCRWCGDLDCSCSVVIISEIEDL